MHRKLIRDTLPGLRRHMPSRHRRPQLPSRWRDHDTTQKLHRAGEAFMLSGQGAVFTLNLTPALQETLRRQEDPGRFMSNRIRRELKNAGLDHLAYGFSFDLTDCGRLHLHGIVQAPISQSLGTAQYSQLYRYFGVTETRLAMLTNGRDVWFFSDIDAPNKMDKKPFFCFDLQAYNANQLSELARFQKDVFDINSILEAASNLRYVEMAADFIKKQLDNPSDEFLKLIGRSIHEGSLTKSFIESLRPAVQAALDEVIRDRIQDTLSISLPPKPVTEVREPSVPVAEKELGDINTTEEELQAFMIVRAIGASVLPIERITMRDAKATVASSWITRITGQSAASTSTQRA